MTLAALARPTCAFTLLGLSFTSFVLGDEPDAVERMEHAFYNDVTSVPVNKASETYPNQGGYNPQRKEGGSGTLSLDSKSAVTGNSLLLRLNTGKLYLQFNPYNSVGRAFARDYSSNPAAWRFNTYNRMRFWIKLPTNHPLIRTDGGQNIEFGTYVKTVADADLYSDETGGGHYYHGINAPALGAWTQVVVNMHPDHRRGDSGYIDPGDQSHPTGEPQYNYFDCLTRFYISEPYTAPTSYPADFRIDDIEFFREPHRENDDQVSSITSTYVPMTNRLIVTWNRQKAEDAIRHSVRYSFQSIHQGGWQSATPCPGGEITPTDKGFGMVYNTSSLPLRQRSVVYIAIKPENSRLFTQIAVPLSSEGPGRPAKPKAARKAGRARRLP